MKLNKAQKKFLFANYYVTAKVLDACVEEGWQDYFMDYFDWSLEGRDQQGFEKLYLIDNGKSVLGKATTGDICYRIGLNFQGSDFETLKSLT